MWGQVSSLRGTLLGSGPGPIRCSLLCSGCKGHTALKHPLRHPTLEFRGGVVGCRPCGDGAGRQAVAPAAAWPAQLWCSYLNMARWVCSCSSPLMTQEKSPKDSAPMGEGDQLEEKGPQLWLRFEGQAAGELSVLMP